MTKAKTLDRLELTRRKFAKQLGLDDTHDEPKQDAPKQETPNDEHFGLSTCPMCEHLTLVHEGGCAHCSYCGWSACG